MLYTFDFCLFTMASLPLIFIDLLPIMLFNPKPLEHGPEKEEKWTMRKRSNP
jgi:hypothetical protein